MISRLSRGLILAGVVLASAVTASAQQGQGQGGQTQQAAQPMPDEYKINLLIRTAVIALNQANQTGNYTVLLDLGAPAFRAGNDSGRLAQVFAAIRQRQVDLSPILFFNPKLVAPPQRDPRGLLRLTGFFPTSPEQVNFDLIFQPIEGQWKIFGIGVSLSPAGSAAAQVPPAQGNTATKGGDGKPDGGQASASKKKGSGEKGASKKSRSNLKSGERPSSPAKGSAVQQPRSQNTAAAQAGREVTRIDLTSPAGLDRPRSAAGPESAASGSSGTAFWSALTGGE